MAESTPSAPEMTRNLATFMVGQGIGTALNAQDTEGDVFLDWLPPQPEQCMALIDTGGYAPAGGMPDLRRTCQVMVRAKGPQAAKRLAWDAYGLFNPVGGRHIEAEDGTVYLTTAVAPPSPLGEDANGRHRYVLNLVVTTTPE